MAFEPLTVLIVEDDTLHADALRQAVNGAQPGGHRVLEARDLASALGMVGREEVDVMLLDLTLPDARGLDAVARVRDSAPHIPFVVITELEDDPVGALALHGGAQDFVPRAQLVRPLLTRSLRYAVDRHRMQRTLRQLSLTDDLTGLYNRRGFAALAEHHLRLARRTRGLLVCVVAVDSLAEIRLNHGGRGFERAVAHAADILRSTFRASDVIARLADAEFAVLALDAAPEAISVIGRRLAERVRSDSKSADVPGPLRIAAALAPVAPRTGSVEILLDQTDQLRAERRPLDRDH